MSGHLLPGVLCDDVNTYIIAEKSPPGYSRLSACAGVCTEPGHTGQCSVTPQHWVICIIIHNNETSENLQSCLTTLKVYVRQIMLEVLLNRETGHCKVFCVQV